MRGPVASAVAVLIVSITVIGCSTREVTRTERVIDVRLIDTGDAVPGGGVLVLDDAPIGVAVLEPDGSFVGGDATPMRLQGAFVVPRTRWVQAIAREAAWGVLAGQWSPEQQAAAAAIYQSEFRRLASSVESTVAPEPENEGENP